MQAGVRSLSLTGTANNATTALGEVAIVNRGTFTRTNGRTAGLVDAALTAFSSQGQGASMAASQTASSAQQGAVSGGQAATRQSLDQLQTLAPIDDAFAALRWGSITDSSTRARAIDPRLLIGSFDEMLMQLGSEPALQRAMPAFTTTERDAGDDALADTSLSIVNDYGNWMSANLDRRVLLMSQDMVAFGATGGESSETDRLRRDEVRPVEMFAA